MVFTNEAGPSMPFALRRHKGEPRQSHRARLRQWNDLQRRKLSAAVAVERENDRDQRQGAAPMKDIARPDELRQMHHHPRHERPLLGLPLFKKTIEQRT